MKPPGLFCSFMKLSFLNSILETNCMGNDSININKLPYEDAWRSADKNYFYPYTCKRIEHFYGGEKEENDVKSLIKDTNNKLEELSNKIESLGLTSKAETIDPLQIGMLASTIKDLRDQFLFLGTIYPATETERPILTEKIQISKVPTETKKLEEVTKKPKFIWWSIMALSSNFASH